MNKLMYWEWLPQIMYNHHQSGPAGTVIFSPPFRDPFNYNFDPMIVTGLDMVGAAHAPPLPAGRQARLHDALRRGLFDLVERRPADDRVLPEHHRPADGDHRQPDAVADPGDREPDPAARGSARRRSSRRTWHFRQSIDYSVTANYAVLDLASRYKDQFLFNIYRMGANQIERGSRDHWTISNEDMARLQAAMAGRPRRGRGRRRGGGRAVAAAARPRRRLRPRPMPVRGGGGRGRGGIADRDLQRGVQGSRAPRSARLRHPRGPGRFSDGHEVHQHAALHRRRDPPGHGAGDGRAARPIPRAPTW